MNDLMSQDERRKREEQERKRAEVRARLEAQSGKNKKKGGFMTPERKKKLRLLLRKKAAEQLKQQQEVKANERRRVIAERVGQKPAEFEQLEEQELRRLCAKFHDRLRALESDKWDLETAVARKEVEIVELASQVSDMRGKFVKPALKRVPKYEQKIERMLLNARKEIGFTVTLKSVKRDQLEKPKATSDSEPEWSWKKSQGANAAGAQNVDNLEQEGDEEEETIEAQ